VHRVVDVMLQKQRPVPMIQKAQKTVTVQKMVQRPVEVTQIQIVEEIVDVTMVGPKGAEDR